MLDSAKIATGDKRADVDIIVVTSEFMLDSAKIATSTTSRFSQPSTLVRVHA